MVKDIKKKPVKATKIKSTTASKSTAKATKATKAPKSKKIAKAAKIKAKTPVKAPSKAQKVTKNAKKTVKPKALTTPKAPVPVAASITITSTPAATVSTVGLGYNPAELLKFKQECKKLGDWHNQKLKDALKNNLQSMSGNKDELIRKVADGIVLGRIPRCTACFGGRPVFDYMTGNYTCRGFHDDTEFIDQIKREPWTH